MLEGKCPLSGYAGTSLAWGLGGISDRVEGIFVGFSNIWFYFLQKIITVVLPVASYYFFLYWAFISFKVHELLNVSFI